MNKTDLILMYKKEQEERELYVSMCMIMRQAIRNLATEDEINFFNKNSNRFIELDSKMPNNIILFKNEILSKKKLT